MRGEYAKEARRERAESRAEARDKRTSQQQLEHLDFLLGIDVGAVKERARLTDRIAEEKKKKRMNKKATKTSK